MKTPKAANKRDQAVIDKLVAHGQQHVLRFWDELSPEGRNNLLRQAEEIDFKLLDRLIAEHVTGGDKATARGEIAPAPVVGLPRTDEAIAEAKKARETGEKLLAAGKVAAFVVAGGQATRLGYDYPKGMFPISPVKGKSLFQLHAEKILARSKRYGAPIPFYVMTSEANHRQTVDFFEQNDYFGLEDGNVRFFEQSMIPAVDLKGKFLLENKGRIFTNPNGHGGSLLALKKSGALGQMKAVGIEEIYYFQVDNPLLQICDPLFIGRHRLAKAQMSTEVVAKDDPLEKVGVIGTVDGKLGVVEYSDLSEEQMRERLPDGRLKYGGGNIAVHMINVAFAEKMNKGGLQLPYHKAVKAVPHVDESGAEVRPEKPNAVKFETFVFDALGFCKDSVTMEVAREEEFHPLKNASGDFSVETVQRAMSAMYGRWLEQAGLALPGASQENPWAVEISPLTALDAEELFAKISTGQSFSWGLCL